MAFATLSLLPISELSPALPINVYYITGVISILWPYSSITRSLSILLGDPDFRKRRHKGQVRITFRTASAKAIQRSELTSGDEIKLGLIGVSWEHGFEAKNTPGKCVEWELEYGGRLLLQFERAGQEPVVVDIEDYAEESERSPVWVDTNGLTPMALKRKRESTGMYGVEVTPRVWQSPAFLKKNLGSTNGTVDNPFINDEDDVFVDIEHGGDRKKPRFSRPSRAWRYVPRSPSLTPAPLNAKEVVSRLENGHMLEENLVEVFPQREDHVQEAQTVHEKYVVGEDPPVLEEQTVVASLSQGGDLREIQPDSDPHSSLTQLPNSPVTYPTLPVSIVPEEKSVSGAKSQSPNPDFDMTGYDPRFTSYKTPSQLVQSTNGSIPHAEPVPEKLDKLTSPSAVASYYSEVDANPISTQENLETSPLRVEVTDEAQERSVRLRGDLQQSASLGETQIHTTDTTPQPVSSSKAQRLSAIQTRSQELAKDANAASSSSLQEPASIHTGLFGNSSPHETRQHLNDQHVRFQSCDPLDDDNEKSDAEARDLSTQSSKPPTIDTDVLESHKQHRVGTDEEPELPQSPKLEPLPSPGLPLISPLTNRKTLPPTAYTDRLQRGKEHDEDYEYEDDEDDDISFPSGSEDGTQDTGQTQRENPNPADYTDSFISNVVVIQEAQGSEEETIEGEKSIESATHKKKLRFSSQPEFSSTTNSAEQDADGSQEGFQLQAELSSNDERKSIEKAKSSLTPAKKRLPVMTQDGNQPEGEGEMVDHEDIWSSDRAESNSSLSNGNMVNIEEQVEDPLYSPNETYKSSDMSDGALDQSYHRDMYEGDDSSDQLPPDTSDDNGECAPKQDILSEDEIFQEVPQVALVGIENEAAREETDLVDDNRAVNSDDNQHLQRERRQENTDLKPAKKPEKQKYEEDYEDYEGDYEEDYEGEYEGDHEDNEEDDYDLVDADDEYEYESEAEVGQSPNKPIEVIEFDSDDDRAEAFIAVQGEPRESANELMKADVVPETLVHDDLESEKEQQNHGIDGVSEEARQELKSGLEFKNEQNSAKTLNPKNAGEADTADQHSPASPFEFQDRQLSGREFGVQDASLEQAIIVASISEDNVGKASPHEMTSQPQDKPAIDQEIEMKERNVSIPVPEDTTTFEVIRPEMGIIKREEKLLSSTEDGLEMRALVHIVSESPQSAINQRLQNLPLTSAQSQQSQVEPKPTSKISPVRYSFNTAMLTPQLTQPPSSTTSFISNVQLSQNLATLLPNASPAGTPPEQLNLVGILRALRSSNVQADDSPQPLGPYFAARKKPLPPSSQEEDEQEGELLDEEAMNVDGADDTSRDRDEMEYIQELDGLAEEEDGQVGEEHKVTDVDEFVEEIGGRGESDHDEEMVEAETEAKDGLDGYEEIVEEETANGKVTTVDGIDDHLSIVIIVKNAKREEDTPNQDDEVKVNDNDEAMGSEASDSASPIRYRRRLSPSDQLEGATPSRIAKRLSGNPHPFEQASPLLTSFRTSIAYYTSLASLPKSFGLRVSLMCIAILTTFPGRSKSGPKDYYSTLYITDPSLFADVSAPEHFSPVVTDSPAYGTRSQRRSTSIQSTTVQPLSVLGSQFVTAQIFRPEKVALPKHTTPGTTGSIVLLRNFKVQTLPSRKPSQKSLDQHSTSTPSSPNTSFGSFSSATFLLPTVQLISTDSSSWAVFPPNFPPSASPSSPRQTRSRSTISVAPSPEVSGPPIEYGEEEIKRVEVLQAWWMDSLKDAEKDALVKTVEADAQGNETSRKESIEISRGRGRGRGRARGSRGKGRTSHDHDSIHELRDGTRWRDDGEEAVGDGTMGVHELRDGTTYRDDEIETQRDGL